MFKKTILFTLLILIVSCKKNVEKIHPIVQDITESVYASGTIKSKNQYQVFSKVNGIIDNVYVDEGDIVKKGSPILSLVNESSKLNKENAALAAEFNAYNNNLNKIRELKINADLAKSKMANDSLLFQRQKELWSKQIGSKVELEQRELLYENSKTAYEAAVLRYDELNRQLAFASSQSKKNLLISQSLDNDYIIRSDIDGRVYSLSKSKGEMAGIQVPLAVIGDTGSFILEMQVDEYDILKVNPGQKALITMDSYKGKVFEAIIQKIDPMMNERSKSFLVEAVFLNKPETLYPSITFEANIVLQSKKDALTIPRNYLLGDFMVVKSNGDKVSIKTGLRDYQKIEVLSGLSKEDELIKPTE
jgi:multidrug efflux pump subunit AcrA (membrane-fusion protein)